MPEVPEAVQYDIGLDVPMDEASVEDALGIDRLLAAEDRVQYDGPDFGCFSDHRSSVVSEISGRVDIRKPGFKGDH